jgi:O-methyltransferase
MKSSLKEIKQQLVIEDVTLIGTDGLGNIEALLEEVKKNKTQGDFVETGVWRGGACIYARLVMDSLKMKRQVYVCDSFKGVPPPNELYPEDNGDIHCAIKELAMSKEEVQKNFTVAENHYGMSKGYTLVEGWFKDTMPELKKKIKSISILRLDGDLYESTIQVLDNLYDLVSPYGFVIIDDYCLRPARKAVEDFRAKRNIKNQIVHVNSCIHYWQKK